MDPGPFFAGHVRVVADLHVGEDGGARGGDGDLHGVDGGFGLEVAEVEAAREADGANLQKLKFF